jgi:hypothetical protein
MRSFGHVLLAGLLLFTILPTSSDAQGPGVIGCSIVPGSWGIVQQGLDKLFFGACAIHDNCYRTCNPIGGPYVGLGYKASCDTVFGLNLAFACQTWASILSFPNIEWVNRDAFLDECLDYAAYGYAAVLSVGTYFFVEGQCNNYCNQWACGFFGMTYGFFQQQNCFANCWPGFDRDNCEMRPWGFECPPCPIGLDLQGNGFKLSGPNPPVYFDLDADGEADHTSWTRMQTKDGFLVFDRNRNGVIDDGRELFGNATPLMLSSSLANHGYEVLEEFDLPPLGGNGDGVIDAEDAVFEHLQVWLDENRDGVTQEGELKSLSEVGVSAISLSYYRADEEDQWGNVLRWWSPIYFEDGSASMSVDIFFERLPD